MLCVSELQCRTTYTMFLHLLVKEYHMQLRDERLNPRPPSWSPLVYLRHSAFKSEHEWTTYFESTNTFSGMHASIHEWVHRKLDRWRFVQSDILNHTRLFAALGPIPTGQRMCEKIELFRWKLFQTWMLSPAKEGLICRYKPQDMPVDFVPFNCWHLWVRLGPGGCKDVGFMIECCTTHIAEAPFDVTDDSGGDEQDDGVLQRQL